nr:LysR substrate-binding domain-containing protein [Stakelama flava]
MLKPHEFPDLRELAAFVAVAEDGGFAEAGRRLNVASSSLSRAVAKLEERLSFSLFRRTTRQVVLTEEGVRTLAQARSILSETEELLDLRSAAKAPAGTIRVNAAVPFMLHVLIPRLPEFRARYPDIELSLAMTDNVVDLISAHADVAIRLGNLPDSELRHRKLGNAAWRLVAAPSRLEKDGHPNLIGEMEARRQVRYLNPTRNNDWWFRGRHKPMRPAASIHAENGEAVRALVLAGCGYQQFSDYLIDDDIAAGRAVSLFPQELTTTPLPVHAVYSDPAAKLKRLEVFLDFLSEICAPKLTG